MLELKEIQRSLPHASQPHKDPDLPELDPRGAPRTHFLNTVPVGLVPLIGPTTSPTSHPELVTTHPSPPKLESPPSPSPPSCPPPSPPSTPPRQSSVTNRSSSNRPKASKPPKPFSPPACDVEPWVPPPPPPRLPYNIPIQPRPVPRFQFLPLLDAPAPPTVSALSNPHPALQQCNSRLLSQDLPKITLVRTPSPRDEKIASQSHHIPQPPPPAAASLTTQNRPSSLPAAQLLPPSPLPSSPPSPGDSKDAPLEDTTQLEAELTRLWHSHSCNTDGETEAEESEAESSVVHTEAESDGESMHGLAASGGGARKVVRTSVGVATASDADDDEEGEMSLVELESGVMAFVRTPRRR